MIDPAWEGDIQFYELAFGTWLAYAFLVFLWGIALKNPLAEWRYVLLTVIGAGAFVINHYFQYSPFWLTLLNTYTAGYIVVWYLVGVRPAGRSRGWQVLATCGSIVFSIAYIGFEMIARVGVANGIHEFWFMLAAIAGMVAVVLWRGGALQSRA